MGYDRTIYAVIEHDTMMNVPEYGKKKWGEIIGVVDLCVCPMDCFKEDANGGVYAHDGNTPIYEDRYGVPMKAAPIDDVIKELNAIVKKENYRRAVVARDMLKAIRKTFPYEYEDGKLMVYSFGH